jgi:hypothetical protein
VVLFEVSALWQRLAALCDARRARGTRYPLPWVLAKLAGEAWPSGIADLHAALALLAPLRL